MENNEYKPGDYIFNTLANSALLITEHYEDGNYLTCGLEAIKKFPDIYRKATKEEITESIIEKEKFINYIRNLIDKSFHEREED